MPNQYTVCGSANGDRALPKSYRIILFTVGVKADVVRFCHPTEDAHGKKENCLIASFRATLAGRPLEELRRAIRALGLTSCLVWTKGRRHCARMARAQPIV